ncbi:MAG: YlxR family protein [Flexistipes sinusarabici]|uniref:YlxR family protein n=1 Tax=Flexistipes sinusarabici TaxID=2352 RepID=A0A5D0ML54_FLESI|nr:YlxR family protein [Flexistipes sinusarabici]TYB33736.1 MAG: YlxR family protein [Flexistipes sinusarabici]
MKENRCAACGVIKLNRELLKFVSLSTGEFALDFKQTMPLKGVYVCAEKKCIKKAADKRLFDKAFGFEVDTGGVDSVLRHVKDVYERYVYTLLRNGIGGGKVVSSAQLKDTNIMSCAKYALISGDIGSDNKSKILHLCGKYNIEYCFFKTKNDYYKNVEGKYRAAYFVLKNSLAGKIKNTVDTLRQINNGSA